MVVDFVVEWREHSLIRQNLFISARFVYSWFRINIPNLTQEGYLHNLTVAQENVLGDVQKWIVDEGIDISDLAQFSLHPKLTLLRYLRANDFDFKKATEHISEMIEMISSLIKKKLQWKKY